MWGRKKEPEHLRPGESIGPYRVEAVLGEGAVGVVYRARRHPGGDVVALKVLKPELARDETFRKRFSNEARSARSVRHRYLVPVVDEGEADGRTYLAVAYVGGGSLDDHIRDRGPLTPQDTARLLSQVASGLDSLHREGLVHRDLKPSNIIIDEEGRALLTDFGLAKGQAYTVLTKPGQVMGTLDYLAPEVIRGQAATPASDIYGLGCVVFECLVGSPPFAEKTVFQVGMAHIEEEPPDPCATREDCPPGLGWAVLRALQKDPAERPPTAIAYGQVVQASLADGTASWRT